jgi:hypothetical protein
MKTTYSKTEFKEWESIYNFMHPEEPLKKWINENNFINQYKDSWDWLMPVVEKCFEYGELDNHFREQIIASFSGIIDIVDTYKAVVEFIKWYNKKA